MSERLIKSAALLTRQQISELDDQFGVVGAWRDCERIKRGSLSIADVFRQIPMPASGVDRRLCSPVALHSHSQRFGQGRGACNYRQPGPPAVVESLWIDGE
ncbi:MAG: hypothetical protein ACR65X_05195 [Methylocystis sp.]